MPRIERRSLLVAALGAPAILASGRSSAQADDRPVITIAVQQIVNANALDTLREQSKVGEWTNEEFNRLSGELETSTDRPHRRAVFRRMLEIAEREDPAYTVIHQNATFTGKRKDIRWRPAPSFVIDLRASNFAVVKG
jgi:hypothetical protein